MAVFEDAFTDKQSEWISLCLELTGEDAVDEIFAFAFMTEHEITFNAFFRKGNEILPPNMLGVDDDLIGEFLDAGIDIAQEMQDVCEEYGKPCPCVFKMTYNVKTHAFDADYDYDSHEEDEDWDSITDCFFVWEKEMKEKYEK